VNFSETGDARAYAGLAAVTVLWGTIPLIVRHVEASGTAIVAVRLAVAAAGLGLAIALGAGGRDRPRLLSYRPGACLAIAAVLAGHWVALFEAYKRTDVSTVILVVYLAPVGVAALAPRLLGERVGWRTWAALAAALAGFLLVALPSVGSASVSGLVLAGVAAVLFVALILVSKPLAEVYGGTRTAFIEFAGAAVLLSPVLVFTDWTGTAQVDWLLMAILGLVHTGAAVAVYLYALARVPATNTGIMGYLEPVSAVLLSWIVLGEELPWTSVAGGVLILAAGVAVVRGSRAVTALEVPTHAAR
jgi:drug/metabolite transporter (DMT)-like permease